MTWRKSSWRKFVDLPLLLLLLFLYGLISMDHQNTLNERKFIQVGNGKISLLVDPYKVHPSLPFIEREARITNSNVKNV